MTKLPLLKTIHDSERKVLTLPDGLNIIPHPKVPRKYETLLVEISLQGLQIVVNRYPNRRCIEGVGCKQMIHFMTSHDLGVLEI